MYCNKCGARNSDEAIFCQKCGLRFDGEEETQIAPSPRNNAGQGEGHHDEEQIFSIRPTLLFVKIGYVLSIAGAFLLVVLMTQIGKMLGVEIPWWISILAGLSLLLIPAFYHLKRNVIRYTLTDSKIEIDEGFIFQNSRNVPLRSIQDVSIASTITQRMLGFGNLVIDNASEDGGKIVFKNINAPKKYADVLLKQMRRLGK